MAVSGKICKVLCCKCSSDSLEPPRSRPPTSYKTTPVGKNDHFAKVGPEGPQYDHFAVGKAALIESDEKGNKEYSDYISSAKAKIRTTSSIGGGERGGGGGGGGGGSSATAAAHSVVRRDSMNDKFTDYIVRAKNKITKASTMVAFK